jgi:hypothetical protein
VASWHEAPYDRWHDAWGVLDTTCVRYFDHMEGQIRHRHAHREYRRCNNSRWEYKIDNYIQGQVRVNMNFWLYTQTITSDWSDYHPRLYYAPSTYFYG